MELMTTDLFDAPFVLENLMGPNCLRLLDELMPNKPENDEYRVYLRQKAEEQKSLINQHFWEDDRFRRGYSEQGSIIGSKNDPETSMWLNPQSWAVISA